MVWDYELHDLIGSVGVLLIVGAYFLLVIRRIASTDLAYSGLNALGAALILFSLSQDFNFPAFLIELFWLLISIVGMAMAVRAKRNATGPGIHTDL